MTSLETKINKLRSIADSLGLQGESVEAIIQMLGYSLHASEVEHIAYSQEASLERATNINSKIQHCVNMLYSVYRGSNPRVIITFNPSKRFLFNKGDLVAKSNNYSIYYLGYWDDAKGEFVEASLEIYPGGDSYNRTILCLLSQNELEDEWTIRKDNLFYHIVQKARDRQDAILSSDYTLYLSMDGSNYTQVNSTRQFSEHEKKNYFFDLTLPGFGINIYYPDNYETLTRQDLVDKTMKIKVHEFLSLSSLNTGELSQLKISGSIPVETPQEIYEKFNSLNNISFRENGLIFLRESEQDHLESIHYLANKNRYLGSYLTTNSDLSFLLTECFPNLVRETTGVFNNKENKIELFYIPTEASFLLTDTQKNKFKNEYGAYYVTKTMEIKPATRYEARFVIDINMYTMSDLTQDIKDILNRYQYKFNINLNEGGSEFQEIWSLITKLPGVKYITNLSISYYNSKGAEVTEFLKTPYYFTISHVINTYQST